MGWFLSLMLGIVTLLRMFISVVCASFGITMVLLLISHILFEPVSGDTASIAMWILKPVVIALVLLFIAYRVSKNLPRFHHFVIVGLIFVLTIILFILMASSTPWFSSALGTDIGVLSGPAQTIDQINNLSRSITGD